MALLIIVSSTTSMVNKDLQYSLMFFGFRLAPSTDSSYTYDRLQSCTVCSTKIFIHHKMIEKKNKKNRKKRRVELSCVAINGPFGYAYILP